MKAVVILPTYNEKENIETMIPFLEEKVFPQISDYEMAVLVADDNSPDGTADEVRKFMKKWDNIAISTGEKQGLGAAYVRAMTYAIDEMKADIVFEFDADGQHDGRKIPQFLKKIDEGYDMVIGTRYSQGGSIPGNWPIQRKAFSVIGNLLVRTILGRFSIHDWTGGFRAIKKDVFLKEKKVLTNFKGYTFQVTFLFNAVKDNFKIAEVPFGMTDRTLGSSKIAPAEYIVDLLTYVITARIIELKRFIKFLVVGGTGFLVQFTIQEFGARAIGFHDVTAVTIGAETAILSNFLINNLWTFSDTKDIKQRSNFFVRMLKFNSLSIPSILIQRYSVLLALAVFGKNIQVFNFLIPVRISVLFPVIILIVIPLNYFIYNKIIWKTQYLRNE